MRTTKKIMLLTSLLAGAIGGCAGVKPRDSFPAVRQDVADRIGLDVHWHDGSPADRAADAKVADLLTQPLDAEAAVQIALLSNRRLQATYENLGVAQADLVAAGLLKNPVFDAAYRFGEGGASARVGLGLTFNFVDLLFLGVRKDLAVAELETAKAGVTAAVLDLAVQTRAAFYDCQAAEQTVALHRQIAAAADASADFAKRLRDAGNTTALALTSEQAQQAETAIALDAAEADAADARERLTVLLGVWGTQTKWAIDGQLLDPTTPEKSGDDLEKQAVARSLELRLARARIATSLKTLGIAQPLGALSEFETGISAEREDGVWFTGPAVALPLPIFSQGQPAAARAAAQLRQANAELYATAVEVRSAARAAQLRVVSLRKQVDAARGTLMPLRQAVVQQTQLQYNAMQVGAFQLLAAKRAEIESAAMHLRLLRDYWIAKSQLELILAGRLPSAIGNVRETATFNPSQVAVGHG